MTIPFRPRHTACVGGIDQSRRDFLKASAAVVATGAVTPSFAQTDPQQPIIDAHSHIWTPDLQAYPLQKGQTEADLKPRSFTPEELMAVAAPHGVTKVVLIQHNIYHGTDNSYITDTIQKDPQRYSGVACIEAAGDNQRADMQRLRKLGIRGLRIRPGDGGVPRWRDCPGMHTMWQTGPELGVAMCPLINPDFLGEVQQMCQQYRETTVVIDHFARIGIDGVIRQRDVEQLAQLARFPNVHVKVSAYYALGDKKPPHDELAPMILTLRNAFGAERLMWASDCPYQLTPPNTYGDSLALIQERIDSLSAEDKDQILYQTANRVFFTAQSVLH